MQLRWAAITCVAAIGIGFGAGSIAAERQPHMRGALRALTTAKAQLQQADGDKGGHREKALRLVDEAIHEVQAGVRYDNRHRGN